MEDHTSWKGHTFTLLVFAGIVVLCAIFFTLGMLVGRTQGEKLAMVAAATAAAKADARPVPAEARQDLTFFESVEDEKQPVLETPPPKRRLDPPPVPQKAKGDPPPSRKGINYQIAALRNSAEAEKLLADVKQKGFRAFILAPLPGDASPFYRVQIGPFSDMAEAEAAKLKVQAAGYKPIVKR